LAAHLERRLHETHRYFTRSCVGQADKKLSDADIAKLLVGKWRFESGPDDPPLKITMTFAKDQTAVLEMESVDLKKVRHQAKAAATWKIDKGHIVTTITKSDNPKDDGKVERSKVTSINASAFKTVVKFTPDPDSGRKEFEKVFEFKKVK
jgi:hypothetical protein